MIGYITLFFSIKIKIGCYNNLKEMNDMFKLGSEFPANHLLFVVPESEVNQRKFIVMIFL